MQLTSGVDVFAHVCGQKADTSSNFFWQYSTIMTRDISVFVKTDTIFRLFFWKLPQIRTSNFRKVLWQHTEGMVGSIKTVLLEIYFSFQQWKKFENPLRIDKVIAVSLAYYFLGLSVKIIIAESFTRIMGSTAGNVYSTRTIVAVVSYSITLWILIGGQNILRGQPP